MKAAARSSAVLLAAAVCALTACGAGTTTGQGSPAPSSASTTAGSTSNPASGASSAATAASSTASASASPAATPLLTAKIAGTGSLSGSYPMSLWAHDVVDDCGAHSHGQQIIAYFAAHPCRTMTRRLWTTTISGRTLALSIISVSAQVTKVNENPDFQYAQQLVDLENADGTGSVNDLMREGKRIPGAASTIPATEVFSVASQDGLVVIIDGWYLSGTNNAKDANLVNIEADLSFSDASAPDA